MSNHHLPYTEDQVIKVIPPLEWDKIQPATPYEVMLPMNGITSEGEKAIRAWVWNESPTLKNDQDFVPVKYFFPEWWSWSWVVEKDESGNKCVGTFPKRFARHAKKAYNWKVEPKQMAELGNLARRHTIETQTVVFDITQNFNWRRGDYGDPGSCFWGDCFSKAGIEPPYLLLYCSFRYFPTGTYTTFSMDSMDLLDGSVGTECSSPYSLSLSAQESGGPSKKCAIGGAWRST